MMRIPDFSRVQNHIPTWVGLNRLRGERAKWLRVPTGAALIGAGVVPNQATTLSQIGTIGGCCGLVEEPSIVNRPDTVAPISSNPGRFHHDPFSPWRTTVA